MKKALLGLALAGLFVSTAAIGGEEWLTDFEAAKKASAEKGIPILADFSGSDWCGWCIRLDREVFNTDAFKGYAKENVVLFQADFPQRTKLPEAVVKQNRKLAEAYRVSGFPTVLLLDAEGKSLARTGYRPGGPKPYIEHLSKLIDDNYRQPAAKKAEK